MYDSPTSPGSVAAIPLIKKAVTFAFCQPANEDLVQGRTGDNAELTEPGNGLREPPVGDSHAHSALNNLGKLKHHCIVSKFPRCAR